ncbi:MAG: hypothetical protein KA155_10235 [Alphaproteobacteria bacterium]|jgi:hypothetical protein|nr:hypothetical protein [Alphaproteobacteria bacterium]
MAEKVSQTIDLSEASRKVRAFVLRGYPDLKPLTNQKGVYAHEYEPGSASKGPISQELLPIQINYFTGQKVVIGGDATGQYITVKPVFATAATDLPLVKESPEPVVASKITLPLQVVEHTQPVANA